MRQFGLRDGERLLAGELIGKRLKGERVVDIGLTPAPENTGWEVATVALARVRDPNLPVPLASAVFVCRPPLETPTGRYVGNVGIQRLLREAPSKPLGRCVDEDVEPVNVGMSDREVAAQLAAETHERAEFSAPDRSSRSLHTRFEEADAEPPTSSQAHAPAVDGG